MIPAWSPTDRPHSPPNYGQTMGNAGPPIVSTDFFDLSYIRDLLTL